MRLPPANGCDPFGIGGGGADDLPNLVAWKIAHVPEMIAHVPEMELALNHRLMAWIPPGSGDGG